MKMTSMKLNPKEMKDKNRPEVPSQADKPSFPYGLRLRLEDDCLKKMALSKLPKVGEKVSISAIAKIISVSQDESRKSIELQITDIGMEKYSKEVEDKFYEE